MENKIDLESATHEFDRFMRDMCLLDKLNELATDEDQQSYDLQKNRIIRAIQAGSLIINDNGEPVFTPQKSADMPALTFYEPDGSVFIAQDKRGEKELFAKINNSLAVLTKTHASTFVKMKASDLRICQALFALFLG